MKKPQMRIVLTPHYKDIFPGEEDTIVGLLDGVPSVLILQLIAMIDAELFSRDEGQKTQLKIFRTMLGRQAPAITLQILKNAFDGDDPAESDRRFFNRHYNQAMMHYALTHFEDLPMEDEDLTPQQELNVFKAYFLIAQLHTKEPELGHTDYPAVDDDYFAKMMWPALIQNFEINAQIYPYSVLVRGVVLLNYLQFKTSYKPYVERFLKLRERKNSMEYAFGIFNMLNNNFESLRNSNRLYASFTIAKSPGFEAILNEFTIDPQHYSERYNERIENFAGIKAKPLYKLNDDTFLVLNWTYLTNKLYDGLLFDFYTASGIDETAEFNSFIKFKNFVSEKVTEKHLFQLMAKAAWNRKFEVLLFDDWKEQGFPDTYYRIGNKIFLIEVKEALFSSEAIHSYSFDLIKAEIDKKMNSPTRGSGQLIKQMIRLKDKPFESPKGYKKNASLEIYPIIIYTDAHFNMPGVSEYVARTFLRMTEENGLTSVYRKIWPVTMININYLINKFQTWTEKTTSLDKQVELFQQIIQKRKKAQNRQHKVENLHKLYDVFEHVNKDFMTANASNRDFIEWTVKALNLTEGLPAG